MSRSLALSMLLILVAPPIVLAQNGNAPSTGDSAQQSARQHLLQIIQASPTRSTGQLRDDLGRFADAHGSHGITELLRIVGANYPVVSILAVDTVLDREHQALDPLARFLHSITPAQEAFLNAPVDTTKMSRDQALLHLAYELSKRNTLWENKPEWLEHYTTVLERLRDHLPRRNWEARHLAVRALGQLKRHAAERLAEESPELSPHQQVQIDELIERLASADAGVHRDAEDRLVQFGKLAVLDLAVALSNDTLPKSKILNVLRRLGEKAAAARIYVAQIAMTDSELNHRVDALQTLAAIGYSDQWLLARLEESGGVTEMISDALMFAEAIDRSELSKQEKDRFRESGYASSRLIYEPNSALAAATWAKALRSQSEKQMLAALFTLQDVKGQGGWEAVTPLRKIAVNGEHPLEQRVAAIRAITKLALNNESGGRNLTGSTTVDTLEACLVDREPSIRFAAAGGLLWVAAKSFRGGSETFARPRLGIQRPFEAAEVLFEHALAAHAAHHTAETEEIAKLALRELGEEPGKLLITQPIGTQLMRVLLDSDATTLTTAQASQDQSTTVEELCVRVLSGYRLRDEPCAWNYRLDAEVAQKLVHALVEVDNYSDVPQFVFDLLKRDPTRLSVLPPGLVYKLYQGQAFNHDLGDFRKQLLYTGKWLSEQQRRDEVGKLLHAVDDDTLIGILNEAPGQDTYYRAQGLNEQLLTLVVTRGMQSSDAHMRRQAYSKTRDCIERGWAGRPLLPAFQQQRARIASHSKSDEQSKELATLDEMLNKVFPSRDREGFLNHGRDHGSLAEQVLVESMRSMDQVAAKGGHYATEFQVATRGRNPAECLVVLAREQQLHHDWLMHDLKTRGETDLKRNRAIPVLQAHPYFANVDLAILGVMSNCINKLASAAGPSDLSQVGVPGLRQAQADLAASLQIMTTLEKSGGVPRVCEQLEPVLKNFAEDIDKVEQQSRLAARVATAMKAIWQHEILRPVVLIASLATIGFITMLLVWLIRPAWIMDVALRLECVSMTWHGMTLTANHVLCIALFQRTHRVADAWVRRHADAARLQFANHPTVKDRALHVWMPVRVDGQLISSPTANSVRDLFSGPIANVLIVGEGGSGKTSIACQLGRWAMSTRGKDRLQKHLMLPILIEDDFSNDRLAHNKNAALQIDSETAQRILKDDNQRLIDVVRGKLATLIGSQQDVPASLVTQLLRQRRILLIVDHFSELSEASRAVISPDRAGFPAKALIVTSRQQEHAFDSHVSLIRPLRVGRTRLIGFVDAYLDLSGARPWFDEEHGEDELDLAQRLKAIVAGREVTILIARMFLDAEIARAKGETDARQPSSVPELMLHYVSWLNRTADGNPVPDPQLLQSAQRLGWHCLKSTLRPSNVSIEDLQGDDGLPMHQVQRLHQLGVVVYTSPLNDQLRFSLDPLSEYFAAFHFIRALGDEQKRWLPLLVCIDRLSAKEITIGGFTRALYDCASDSRAKVPDRVLAALREKCRQLEEGPQRRGNKIGAEPKAA